MPFAWRSSLRWVVLLAIISASASVEFVRHSALHNLANSGFWMHLRIGTDILNSHTLPRTGWASQISDHSWVDATWLFDVLVAFLYRVLDLRVILIGGLAARVTVAGAIFLLAGGMRGRFWTAVGLSLLGQIILSDVQPLPVVGSMLCFAAEFLVLKKYRDTGAVRSLYALPLLFALWANLDFNFVLGIAALVIFVASEQLREKPEQSVTLNVAALTALAASCLTPYGWKPYAVFLQDATNAAGQYLPGHVAMRFRTPQDYLLMLLAMTAFLLLGRLQSRDWFMILVVLTSALAAFYAQRYAWLLVLSAVASIGTLANGETVTAQRQIWKPVTAFGMVILIFLAATVLRYDRPRLMTEVAQTYPVHAADYLRGRGCPPVFNSMEFGGFLAWYWPGSQIAIDDRPGLYSEDYGVHYARVMNAEEHFSTLGPLMQAQYLLLSKSSMMATALATVPSFKTVYSDEVAVVLERSPAAP